MVICTRLSPSTFLHGWRRGQFCSLLEFKPLQYSVPPAKRSPFHPWISKALAACFGPKTMLNMIHAKTCKVFKHVYSHLKLHTVYQVKKTRLINWTRWLSRPRNACSHSWPTVAHWSDIWVRRSTASCLMLQEGSRENKNTTELGPAPTAKSLNGELKE